eukprot:scaffold21612_cov115-Isochrysis_galbana.AAC.3
MELPARLDQVVDAFHMQQDLCHPQPRLHLANRLVHVRVDALDRGERLLARLAHWGALRGRARHLLQEQRVDAQPLHRPEEERLQRNAARGLGLVDEVGRAAVGLARLDHRLCHVGVVAAVCGIPGGAPGPARRVNARASARQA